MSSSVSDTFSIGLCSTAYTVCCTAPTLETSIAALPSAANIRFHCLKCLIVHSSCRLSQELHLYSVTEMFRKHGRRNPLSGFASPRPASQIPAYSAYRRARPHNHPQPHHRHPCPHRQQQLNIMQLYSIPLNSIAVIMAPCRPPARGHLVIHHPVYSITNSDSGCVSSRRSSLRVLPQPLRPRCRRSSCWTHHP